MKILIFIVAVLSILYLYEIFIYRRKNINKSENTNELKDLTAEHSARDIPISMALINHKGDIVWYNSKFLELTEMKADAKIGELIPDFKLDAIGIENEEDINIKHEDKYYKVLYSVFDISQNVKGKTEHMSMLYFIDQTDYVNLNQEYIDKRVNIGFIYIDNYEELMDETDDTSRFLVLAEVDKKLNILAHDINSIIKKTDRNKYLMIFNNEKLDFLRKFQILDEIRNIDLGNTIPVTLSMGIGIGQASLEETYESAKSAMDIALGRGGDQAVIKDKEKISFYGGSIQALEKRTKVRARVISYALKQFIDQSENVFIMGHKVGDMDSFGASIGIYRIAKNRGKKCFIVLNSLNPSIENIYETMQREQPDYLEDIVSYEQVKNMSFKSSVAIIVDTHIPKQTEAPGLLERAEKLIVIDHHRRGESFIEDPVLSYVETYASSTCELITEMLYYIEEDIYITEFDAKALLAGIAVDTKNFAVNTGVRTFEAASFLRKRGADTLQVRQLFENDLDDYRFKGEIIKNISLFKKGIAISRLDQEVQSSIIIAAQAADEILNIKDIDAVFVLARAGKNIHISGRSSDNINVQRILEKLGGGGHMTVAGAQVKDSTMEEVENQLKKYISKYLEEGEDK